MKAFQFTCASVFALSIAGVSCLDVSADAEKAASEKKKLPKSGLLAVSSVSGAGTSVVSDVFGGEDIFGTELPPIAGSISRRGESSWRFSVINNSKDRYSVNVDLVQKNENGSTVKFGSYSYTLRPGQSDGEEVAAGVGARRAELTLRSYRNLSERAREVKKEEQ
jgi:hypothetical protein